jgi:hypothetical protein
VLSVIVRSGGYSTYRARSAPIHSAVQSQRNQPYQVGYLRDHGGGGGRLISPGWWENTDSLVVAGQAVDAGLDENQAELGVLVLTVALKVLADGNSLLNG